MQSTLRDGSGAFFELRNGTTNPDTASPLPYFRGKALLEEELRKARFSYAIVRPTVLFSVEDILINNIAFLLRNFPLFITLAEIAVEADRPWQLVPLRKC